MNETKAKEFVSFARQVAHEETVWADWHNRVFGVDGKFAEVFPTDTERMEFSESGYYVQIEKLADALREGKRIEEYTLPVTTASGKLLLRLPKSLHEALAKKARDEGVSLNQLIVYRLAITLRDATKELVEGGTCVV